MMARHTGRRGLLGVGYLERSAESGIDGRHDESEQASVVVSLPDSETIVEIHDLDAASDVGPETPLLEQALRVAVGISVLTLAAVVSALRSRTVDHGPGESNGVPLLAGAVLGVATQTALWATRVAVTTANAMDSLLGIVLNQPLVRGPAEAMTRSLRGLDIGWQVQRSREERAAAAFIGALIPEIVNGLMERADLTGIALDQIDVDRIVDKVDIDRILERIDIQSVAQRIDLNELAARIDVDGVATRIDLDAIVERIDVVGIARGVIEELDLSGIIRESTGVLATETVDEVRIQGMSADRAVARFVDRLLRRERRELEAPGTAEPNDDRGRGE